MLKINGCAALVASALLLTAGPALAQDRATAAEIEAAMADRTLQGSMTSDAFAEFYAADGSIAGDGYAGKWRIVEDEMCFSYGTDDENCWALRIDGPAVTLYKDGEVDGTGMLIEGNPNDF